MGIVTSYIAVWVTLFQVSLVRTIPMGHQVEYLIEIPQQSASRWLSTLSGWWAEPESTEEPPHGIFQWGELSLHTVLGPKACQISVPKIKYSWLIANDPPSLEQIARLEEWLSKSFFCAGIVRLDELLWLDWESQSSEKWWQLPDPLSSLRSWLLSTEQDPAYFRLFP